MSINSRIDEVLSIFSQIHSHSFTYEEQLSLVGLLTDDFKNYLSTSTAAKKKKEKDIWLAGFKKGLDSKSCCCNLCTLHSIALEEKVSNGEFWGE